MVMLWLCYGYGYGYGYVIMMNVVYFCIHNVCIQKLNFILFDYIV